jgi:hypothetical protein
MFQQRMGASVALEVTGKLVCTCRKSESVCDYRMKENGKDETRIEMFSLMLQRVILSLIQGNIVEILMETLEIVCGGSEDFLDMDK